MGCHRFGTAVSRFVDGALLPGIQGHAGTVDAGKSSEDTYGDGLIYG